jgi:hypothetical protein
MLSEITVYEFLSNILVQPDNVWSALVIGEDETAQTLEELQDGIEIFAECTVASFDVQDAEAKIDSSIDYLLLWNFDQWTTSVWQQFDYRRSYLDRGKRGGSIIISESAMGEMLSNAPNFASWIGSKIFRLILGSELLTDEECEKRLATLREWKGLTDEEVIAQAEAKKLPRDPEYGEWLILLNRGDLIGC